MAENIVTKTSNTIGKYRILRELGHGGMAIVYQAFDTENKRDVALKILPPTMVDRASVARFHREGQAQKKLKHPNIVEVYEAGTAEGTHFIAMEFVEGKTVRNLVRRSGSLSIEKTLDIVLQVSKALDYAHKLSFIHRDVKSSNIMVDEHGQVKLMDFGLVQITGATILTKTGAVMGTPEYMSPEQISGEEIDFRSDLYSLGISMYEMLTGKLPFEGENPQAITMQHKYEQPKPIKEMKGNIPEAVENIVMKALAKDVSERYQTAAEIIKDIENYLSNIEKGKGETTTATQPSKAVADELLPDISLPKRSEGKRCSLPQLFLSSGCISEQQVKEAFRRNIEKGEPFRESLLKLGYLSEENMARLTTDWLGIKVLTDINKLTIEPETLSLIPEKFARKNQVLPVTKDGDELFLAMVNPLDIFTIDNIQYRTGCNVHTVMLTKDDFKSAVEKFYEKGGAYETILKELGVQDSQQVEIIDDEEQQLEEEQDEIATEAPIIKLVNYLIHQAVRERASDIHIEPDERRLRVRYRVDGFLREALNPPKNFQSAIVSRIKIMAEMDIAERRIPQDGRIKLRLENRNIDLRISTLPGIYGEKVVIRILDESSLLLGLEQLGFENDLLKRWEGMISRPYGIILVTGPTGSGKTTTLYSTLHQINTIDTNIITVEDPVEYRLEGITQVQVNPKAGVTFASGLRSIFRQDPDIIMVGEMRDLETAQISIKAALTGHLVFSTLHTNDAPGAITRLLDMGIPPYLVASSLIGVLAQRLARVICPNCKKEFKPSKELLQEAGLPVESDVKFHKGAGCKVCQGSGYRGRTAMFELMELNEEIKKHIIMRSPTNTIKQAASATGMRTLWEEGINKAIKGMTTFEEVKKRTAHFKDE